MKKWIFLLFAMVLLAFWLLIHIGCGADIKAESEKLKTENNNLKSENDKLKLEVQKLNEEIQKIGEKEATIVSLTSENEALKKQVEYLKAVKMGQKLLASRPPTPPPAKLGPLFWNVWAEEGSEVKFNPVTHLEPRTEDSKPEYTIYIHLSNLGYEKEGFVTWKPGEKLINLVDEQLRILTEPSLTLQVILIPDSDYFAPPKKLVKDLTIDLNRIRKQSGSLYIADNPLEVLRRQRILPDFVFGSTFFEGIKTREKEGTGHIGLAMWHNGKPVEDLTLAFCISSSGCVEETPKLSSQEKKLLPLNLSLPPAAALHFFGLGSEKVAGVFWNNEKPEKFIIWDINRSPDEFYKYFGDTIIQQLNNAKTGDQLCEAGSEFFDFLFPTKGDVDTGLEFKEYIKKHIREKPFGSKDLPLMFVRFTENKEGLPFIIPLGLMAVDIGKERGEFIGFHFKLEAPLKYETFSDKPKCITRWVVTLPTTPQLSNAYKKINKDIIKMWTENAFNYPSIGSFKGWIGKSRKDETATAIVVLAHHGKNTFSDGQSSLPSSSVKRAFSQPSIAILNGCGTMEPGGTDFIKQLNERGVTTVIATSTPVDEKMGGDFINCFGKVVEEIDKEATKRITISKAFVKTLTCLYSENPNYGTNVLRYSLLGNGDLSLCVPKKEGTND